MKAIWILSVLLVSLNFAQAQTEVKVVNADTINVDGYLAPTEKASTDKELEDLQTEIKRQKTEIVLNKEKAKKFQELSKSVEKLSETTEEMIEEKKAAKAEIADYNAKVKCLQSESTGAECAKYNRHRR
jgi:seryl-tRNA synthetase